MKSKKQIQQELNRLNDELAFASHKLHIAAFESDV